MNKLQRIDTRDGLDEIIRCHLENRPYQTTDAMRRIMARLNFIFDLIQTYHQTRPDLESFKIRRTIIKEVVQEYGVSVSQAGMDYELVCEKYQVENVGAELQYSLKTSLKDIDEDMEQARSVGDMNSVSKLHRAKAAYLALMPKEKSNLSSLPFAHIRMVFDPKLINSTVNMSFPQMEEWVDGVIASEKKTMIDALQEMAETVTVEDDDND